MRPHLYRRSGYVTCLAMPLAFAIIAAQADEPGRERLGEIAWELRQLKPIGKDAISSSVAKLSIGHGLSVFCVTAPFREIYQNHVSEGSPPAMPEVAKCLPAIVAELDLYPRGVFEKAKLSRIVLAGDLRHNSEPMAGRASAAQQALVLDPSDCIPSASETIHHEVFHMIDADASVLPDVEWAKLNPKGFVYRTTKRARRDAYGTLPSDGIPGFVDWYATTSIVEDKAETFSVMMSDHRFIEKLGKKDPVLQSKAACIREALRRFDAGFDDRFWENARNRKRPGA